MNPVAEHDRPWAEHRVQNDLVGALTDGVMIASALTLLGLLVAIAYPPFPLLLATLVFEALAALLGGDTRD